MQAALQLLSDLGDFGKISADAVLQRALRAAAGVEHVAGHAAAADLCGDLVRLSGAAAAARSYGVLDHPEASTAAGGDPWLKWRRPADGRGHGPC